MTRLTKPITRKVPSLSYGDLVITIAEEGVYYRQPRRRQSFLLPHGRRTLRRKVTLDSRAISQSMAMKAGSWTH